MVVLANEGGVLGMNSFYVYFFIIRDVHKKGGIVQNRKLCFLIDHFQQ